MRLLVLKRAHMHVRHAGAARRRASFHTVGGDVTHPDACLLEGAGTLTSLRRMRLQREYDAKITVQRSRFLAALIPVANLDEVRARLAARSRKLRKANHHCWAARFTDLDGVLQEPSRDDGEVGKPGRRILDAMRSSQIDGGLLIVSRIFGGVKLGPAGVGRAFRDAARAVCAEVER